MSGLNSEYRNMINQQICNIQLENTYKSDYDIERNLIINEQNVVASHQQKNNRYESEETRLKQYYDRLSAHPMRPRKRV